ncbi:MAG TPA: DNA methyltransferase [Candidatus Saccharimonadales bacterium]|nr:DNA methyltransferase [Candidatus Saccharimonadales bacterium]
MQSVLILGRQPALGLAELESLYGAAVVQPFGPGAAGLDLHAHDVDFARLGGSTRLAHVLAELPAGDWKAIEKRLPELVLELALTLPDGKIQLGLSAYGLHVSPAKLNAAALTLKKTLRSRLDRSVRVIPNPETELGTAQVLHNHLTGPTGIELLVITHGQRTVIARTTKVQDITSYTLRDRGRPKRDARVGMLPPKLAQIIINLASGQAPPAPGTIVLDPFCGTGVVLQEAMLMGFSAYGTDLEPRMIEYSRANLAWLRETIGIGTTSGRLEPGDATNYHWDDIFAVVAAETYLGRPFTAKPAPEVLAQTASEVNLILKKFLGNIHGQLAPGARLCLAVPAWQISPGNFKHLPLIDGLGQLGYNLVRFEHIRDGQLLYYREDQIVARELLVITRK